MSVTITREAIEFCGGVANTEEAFDKLFTNTTGKTINGHYWVERDGVIIDPYFPNYDSFKKFHGIKKNKKNKRVYFECQNPITNQVALKYLEDQILKPFGDKQKTIQLLKMCGFTPEPRCCGFNAIMESEIKGGVIKFGSVGMESDDKTKTIWIYGNKNYSTLADFAKYDNDRITFN